MLATLLFGDLGEGTASFLSSDVSHKLVLGASFPAMIFNIACAPTVPYTMRDLLTCAFCTLKELVISICTL